MPKEYARNGKRREALIGCVELRSRNLRHFHAPRSRVNMHGNRDVLHLTLILQFLNKLYRIISVDHQRMFKNESQSFGLRKVHTYSESSLIYLLKTRRILCAWTYAASIFLEFPILIAAYLISCS